jgi:16S rRNA (cytosine967-C5)-methyltransferase
LKASPEQLAERWEKEGVRFFPRQFDWVIGDLVFELKDHPALRSLGSFQDGWFYIQDPSTLLAPALLAPMPGETVLDLCAAPGGKTTALAALMQNQGKVLACDPAPARRELLRENVHRLGTTCVEVRESISPDAAATARFDKALVDAPCSNSGVLRRRVDLRWRVKPDELDRMRATQLDLLLRAAPRLRPGGALVYSTCSLEPEENENVIRDFLKRAPEFALETERRLAPFADAIDGAYVARVCRSNQ